MKKKIFKKKSIFVHESCLFKKTKSLSLISSRSAQGSLQFKKHQGGDNFPHHNFHQRNLNHDVHFVEVILSTGDLLSPVDE
jgi:hypothetical protein